MTPEEGLRLLWCNVLFRMIEDASYSLGSTSVASDLEIEQAREWILVPNRDFEIACQLAGYEADRIRAKVKPLIEAAQKLDGSSEAISPRKRQSRPRLVKHTTRKPRQRGELFVGADGLEQFEPVHHRHVPVGQHHVHFLLLQQFERLRAVGSHQNALRAHLAQLLRGDLAHGLEVIDHEEARLLGDGPGAVGRGLAE